MSDTVFSELRNLKVQEPTADVCDRLVQRLREKQDYHRLFDAILLKRKHELGLPLSRPSSLADVPAEQRKLVEETYVNAAREVGNLFLKDGDIPNAWTYHQVIKEPQAVAEAINALPVPMQSDDRYEQVMQIALFQGVNPKQGLKLSLKLHGTCSTITALDQALPNLAPEQRSECAKAIVQSLYNDVRENVARQVQQRMPVVSPDEPLRPLIAGRDWLFEGGNYHIDVSHLHSVVRFGRSIEPVGPETELALQLAEYGTRLDSQLQYAGEAPFDDYYRAHAQFFKVLLDKGRDEGLAYFRTRLESEQNEQDKPFLAYVLTDLLMRIGRLNDAVDIAEKHLTRVSDEVRFSFAELCLKAGRLDALANAAEANADPVAFVAALLG